MIRAHFRRRLFLNSLFLVFFFLLISGGLFLYLVAPELAASENLRLEQKSREAAVILGKALEFRMASVRAVGNNPLIKSGAQGSDASGALKAIKSANPDYSELLIVDPDGKVTASAGEAPSYSFLNDKQFLASLSGKTSVSDVHKDGESRFSFWIFSPVSDAGGSLHSVVAAKIPLRAVWDVADNMKFGSFGFVFVSGASGRIIAHPDKGNILGAIPYDFKYGPDKISGIAESDDLIAGYSGFPESTESLPGWKVFAAIPKDVAFSDFGLVKSRFILAGIIALLISLAAAYAIAQRTAKPLLLLDKEIKEALVGSKEYRFSPGTNDEVQDISDAFSGMMDELKDKDLLERVRSNLEKKVHEQEKLNKLLVGRENEIAKMKRKLAKSKDSDVS